MLQQKHKIVNQIKETSEQSTMEGVATNASNQTSSTKHMTSKIVTAWYATKQIGSGASFR